jgi:hypothetical protein
MSSLVKTKVLLYSRKLSIYLVRYSAGHRVVPHIDAVEEGKLCKVNWVLLKPQQGGKFLCEKTILNLFGRWIVFRPDLYQHEVTRIERGNRWLLTFAFNW